MTPMEKENKKERRMLKLKLLISTDVSGWRVGKHFAVHTSIFHLPFLLPV